MDLNIQRCDEKIKIPRLEPKNGKFKQFFNNPITKFLLSNTIGFIGIGSLVCIAKLIYDKTHKYNYKQTMINGIVLHNRSSFYLKKFFLVQMEK